MAKFSDVPKFILTEYINQLSTLDPTPTTTVNAHLRGDSIITRGGNVIELYIDNTTEGYKKIILSFSSLTDNLNNTYFFNKNNQLTYNDTSDIYGPNEAGDYFIEGAKFKIYDESTLESVTIENTQNVYFRKDSVFHNWLKDGADTIFQDQWYSDFLAKNFININEMFIYFGKIYETDEDDVYTINYENFPEFTQRILPEHQRTDKIKEFLNLSFGNIWSEIYHKTKDLPNLIDAMSVDDDMLNYIVEFTNWSFLDKDEYTLAEREFVRDIVLLLKRKGTVSSIYLLYKVFSNNSNNRLNVYERWHDSSLTGQISAGSYEDYLYLHNYITSLDDSYLNTGTGSVYYKQYFPNGEWSDNLTNNSTHSGSSWTVNHNLNTYNIIFQIYDFELKKILPKTSYLLNKNVLEITFDENINGMCFIRSATYRKSITTDYTSIISSVETPSLTGSAIDHTFNMLATSMFYDADNYGINPRIIKLSDGYVETEQTDGNIIIDEATEKVWSDAASTVWDITHSIDKTSLLIDVYNEDNERILPEEVQIVDENNVQITLSESLSGYVLLTEIGSAITSIEGLDNYDDLILSPSYIVELDLTTEPVNTDAILNEATSENLIMYWEKTRPINNVSNYQLLFSPKSDITGNYHNLYETVSNDLYAKSKLIGDPSYFEIGDSSSYFVLPYAANTTQWVVSHNLNTLNVMVQCYDTNDEFIKPKSINYTDSNTITIDFVNIVNGTVVVAKTDYYTESSIDIITHNLNDDIIENVSTSTRDVYEPDKVTLTDDNTLTINNILPNSKAQVKGTTVTYNFTNSSAWYIEHDTGYIWFLSEFYNSNDEQIYPDNIKIIDENTAQAEFGKTITGYAVLYFIPETVSIYDRLENASITISDTQDNIATYDYITSITSIHEDSNFIYLTAEIPKDDKYTIREIGVLDGSGTKIFVTDCSDIVKDNDVKMIIFYKISKEDLNG